MTHWLSSLGELWVSVNKCAVWFYRDLEWDVRMPEGISHKGRYLVFCNHQSGVDILALQHCLNRRAPFGRYLLKHQLIWVPVLGVAWWALDMAFLRRYSKQELLRNPSLARQGSGKCCACLRKAQTHPGFDDDLPRGNTFDRGQTGRRKTHLTRTC